MVGAVSDGVERRRECERGLRGGKVEEGLTHEARWGFTLVCYKIKLVQF